MQVAVHAELMRQLQVASGPAIALGMLEVDREQFPLVALMVDHPLTALVGACCLHARAVGGDGWEVVHLALQTASAGEALVHVVVNPASVVAKEVLRAMLQGPRFLGFFDRAGVRQLYRGGMAESLAKINEAWPRLERSRTSPSQWAEAERLIAASLQPPAVLAKWVAGNDAAALVVAGERSIITSEMVDGGGRVQTH